MRKEDQATTLDRHKDIPLFRNLKNFIRNILFILLPPLPSVRRGEDPLCLAVDNKGGGDALDEKEVAKFCDHRIVCVLRDHQDQPIKT